MARNNNPPQQQALKLVYPLPGKGKLTINVATRVALPEKGRAACDVLASALTDLLRTSILDEEEDVVPPTTREFLHAGRA